MYVKPVKGRTVRDPVTHHELPAEGREVPDSAFWQRRVRDGDLKVGKAPAAAGDDAAAQTPAKPAATTAPDALS